MTVVDLVFLLVILISVAVGVFRGLIREVLSVAAWAVAIWLALRFAYLLKPFFAQWIVSDGLLSVVAFLVLFVCLVFLLSLLAYLLASLTDYLGIQGTNRVLGGLFGLLRGVLVLAVSIWVLLHANLSRAVWWQDSMFIPYLELLASYLDTWLYSARAAGVIPDALPAEAGG